MLIIFHMQNTQKKLAGRSNVTRSVNKANKAVVKATPRLTSARREHAAVILRKYGDRNIARDVKTFNADQLHSFQILLSNFWEAEQRLQMAAVTAGAIPSRSRATRSRTVSSRTRSVANRTAAVADQGSN